MIKNDRFTRGWVAGTCGGFIGGLLSILFYNIGLSDLRLVDWSAILVFGRTPPFSIIEEIYALVMLAGSTGFAGVLFAYLLRFIGEKSIYFKGWVFFLLPWWLIYLLTALAQTQGTLNLSIKTTLSNGISISLTGISAVIVYQLLEPKRQ